ncbi:MAG TPA: DUF255 domain-containing protein, partial [Nitratifractor sp.]|nr:DUF255 domain-containing protein [Nitratifractor sp.]
MRRLFLLFLLLLAPLMADGIKWYTDVQKAQAAAQESKKIIFVYVEAAHCPYCEEMLNDTLSDKDVVRNINNDYIA